MLRNHIQGLSLDRTLCVPLCAPVQTRRVPGIRFIGHKRHKRHKRRRGTGVGLFGPPMTQIEGMVKGESENSFVAARERKELKELLCSLRSFAAKLTWPGQTEGS